MTYNVHLLTHLAECVEQNGPLWAYSNFHFESNNGVLKNFVCGTSDVVHQTLTKYLYSQLLHNVVEKTEMVKTFETTQLTVE